MPHPPHFMAGQPTPPWNNAVSRPYRQIGNKPLNHYFLGGTLGGLGWLAIISLSWSQKPWNYTWFEELCSPPCHKPPWRHRLLLHVSRESKGPPQNKALIRPNSGTIRVDTLVRAKGLPLGFPWKNVGIGICTGYHFKITVAMVWHNEIK